MLKIFGLSLIAVATLSACGGGSESSGDSGAQVPVAVSFTTSNYQQAAQEAFESSDSMTSLPTGVQSAGASSLVRLGKEQFFKLQALRTASAPQATGVTSTTTIDCGVSGSVTVSFNYASPYVYTPGDSFTSSYNQCVESGYSINGTLIGILRSYNMSGTVEDTQAGLEYRNLTVATSAARIVGNGALIFTEKSSPDIPEYEGGMTTSSFSVAATYGSITYSRALTNFSASYKDTSTSTTRIMNGTLTSSALGGRYVTIATITPFITAVGDVYPSSGQFVLTGSGGGKVRVTAVNSSYVRIELDANGDGVYETLVQKLWTAP